jgi:hypothetical protein
VAIGATVMAAASEKALRSLKLLKLTNEGKGGILCGKNGGADGDGDILEREEKGVNHFFFNPSGFHLTSLFAALLVP